MSYDRKPYQNKYSYEHFVMSHQISYTKATTSNRVMNDDKQKTQTNSTTQRMRLKFIKCLEWDSNSFVYEKPATHTLT